MAFHLFSHNPCFTYCCKNSAKSHFSGTLVLSPIFRNWTAEAFLTRFILSAGCSGDTYLQNLDMEVSDTIIVLANWFDSTSCDSSHQEWEHSGYQPHLWRFQSVYWTSQPVWPLLRKNTSHIPRRGRINTHFVITRIICVGEFQIFIYTMRPSWWITIIF